jgi:hypothetical protein
MWYVQWRVGEERRKDFVREAARWRLMREVRPAGGSGLRAVGGWLRRLYRPERRRAVVRRHGHSRI